MNACLSMTFHSVLQPVDFLPQQDLVAHDQLIKKAEGFIKERFMPRLATVRPEPLVHIIKVRAHNPQRNTCHCLGGRGIFGTGHCWGWQRHIHCFLLLGSLL